MTFVSEELKLEALQEALQSVSSSQEAPQPSQSTRAKAALGACSLIQESHHALLSHHTKGVSTAPTPKTGAVKGKQGGVVSPEMLALLGNLDQTLKQQNTAVSQAAVNASAPQGTVGASAPQSAKAAAPGAASSSSFPQPSVPFPPNNPPCPLDPSVPASASSWSNDGGYLGKLSAFIQWICNHPADLQAKMNFTQYLFNLQAAGDMQPGSDVMSILNGSPQILNNLMPEMVDQFAEWTFFNGYQGINGPSSTSNYLQQIQAFVAAADPSGSNPYLQAMSTRANQWRSKYLATFTAQHYSEGRGLFYYTITLNGATYGYSYNTPSILGNGADMINSMIMNYSYQDSLGNPPPFAMNFNQSQGGATYSGLDQFMKDYRLTALEDLLKKFKNPEIAISLWMMQAYDQQFQGQEGGLADTTTVLTNMTDQYATPLLQQIQTLGNWQDADTTKFLQLLMNSTTLMNGQQQTSGSMGTPWNNNVFNAIWNTSIPGADPSENTVGKFIQLYLSSPSPQLLHGLTIQLNTLNAQTNPQTPNVGYQAMVSALQAGGALVTGTSKTISTQLSTVANLDNEVIKYGHSVVDPTGGGLVQLMNKIIDAQISH